MNLLLIPPHEKLFLLLYTCTVPTKNVAYLYPFGVSDKRDRSPWLLFLNALAVNCYLSLEIYLRNYLRLSSPDSPRISTWL